MPLHVSSTCAYRQEAKQKTMTAYLYSWSQIMCKSENSNCRLIQNLGSFVVPGVCFSLL